MKKINKGKRFCESYDFRYIENFHGVGVFKKIKEDNMDRHLFFRCDVCGGNIFFWTDTDTFECICCEQGYKVAELIQPELPPRGEEE